MKTAKTKILEIAKKLSTFRTRDIKNIANPRIALSRMVTDGELVRIGHGLYSLPEPDIGENHSLAEATQRYPGGVICLISALFFHQIGTELPYETWIMRNDKRIPRNNRFPVRFVYSSGEAFSYGIEFYDIEGIKVAITSSAKTVADCFKYRNKIGLDVAMEALREGWRRKLFTMDELTNASRACRVSNVILPYLEMLVK